MHRNQFWRPFSQTRQTPLGAATPKGRAHRHPRLCAMLWRALLALCAVLVIERNHTHAQSGAATGELAYVPTPVFETLAPVGWTATWYGELNTLLATPDTNDSTAPSLLIGLAGARQSLDPAEMADYLGRLVIDGGRFVLASQEATAQGDLLLYKNTRGDRRAAVLLTPMAGGGVSALTIFVADARDFDAHFGSVLTRRIGASVRPRSAPTQAAAAPPSAAAQRAQPAAATQQTAAAATTSRPPQAAETTPAAGEAAPAQNGADAELAPYLDRPLAPVDLAVEADRNAAPLLRGLVMTLWRDGAATLVYEGADVPVEGAWRRNGEAIEVDWPPGETSQAPSRWRFRVRPDGLGVLSVRMRPVRALSEDDLIGRLVLDGGDPLQLRPAPGSAAIAVGRIDFAGDGRFSVRGQGGRSAGGTFVQQGDAVVLRFWEGGESTVAARVMPQINDTPQLVEFGGHRYTRASR